MWGLWKGGCQGPGPGPTPGHTRPPPHPSAGTASTWARPPGGYGPPSRRQPQNSAGPLRVPWGPMSVGESSDRRQTEGGSSASTGGCGVSPRRRCGRRQKGKRLREQHRMAGLAEALRWHTARAQKGAKWEEAHRAKDRPGPGPLLGEGARNAPESAASGTDTVVLRSSISQSRAESLLCAGSCADVSP